MGPFFGPFWLFSRPGPRDVCARRVSGPSGAFGPRWGPKGPYLGPFWGHGGAPFCGPAGAPHFPLSFGPSAQKGRKPAQKGPKRGPFGPLLGPSAGSARWVFPPLRVLGPSLWGPPGPALGPLRGHIWAPFGLSFRPFWALLGASFLARFPLVGCALVAPAGALFGPLFGPFRAQKGPKTAPKALVF